MVGRSAEMDLLGRAFDGAAEGRGGAILLSGEAGVGKTRLVTEFVAAHGAGATVLVGGGLALADGAPPSWPVIDAPGSLRRREEEPALARIASADVAEAGPTGDLAGRGTLAARAPG